MPSDATIIQIVIGLAGVLGGGALAALFKVGPQRKHIVVDAAQGAVLVQTGVLNNLREEIARLQAQVTSLEMENAANKEQLEAENEELQKKLANCEATTERLRRDVEFLHRDVDRHGRMSDLARRRSHVLSNGFQSMSMRAQHLIDYMNKQSIPPPAELLPYKLLTEVQSELDQIAEIEGKVTYAAAIEPPPL